MCRKGFTFLELLLALAILSVGITQIFRVFLGCATTLQYIKNRLAVNLLIQERKHEATALINQRFILGDFTQRKTEQVGVLVSSEVRLRKIPSFSRLYVVEVAASWNQEKKDTTLTRRFYRERIASE